MSYKIEQNNQQTIIKLYPDMVEFNPEVTAKKNRDTRILMYGAATLGSLTCLWSALDAPESRSFMLGASVAFGAAALFTDKVLVPLEDDIAPTQTITLDGQKIHIESNLFGRHETKEFNAGWVKIELEEQKTKAGTTRPYLKIGTGQNTFKVGWLLDTPNLLEIKKHLEAHIEASLSQTPPPPPPP